MNRTFKFICIFCCIVLIIITCSYFSQHIGISKQNIENDARLSVKVPDDWQVSSDVTERLSAMIFYDDTFNDCKFAIYEDFDYFSYGYFFRYGGSMKPIREGIGEFYIDSVDEYVYISMNKQQVNKVEYKDNNVIKNIEIDATKPFVFILPSNTNLEGIYDIQGNIVDNILKNL